MRVVRTRVLPLPAPARMSAHCRASVTAFSCSGLRLSRMPCMRRKIVPRKWYVAPFFPQKKEGADSGAPLSALAAVPRLTRASTLPRHAGRGEVPSARVALDRRHPHAAHVAQIRHQRARLGFAREPADRNREAAVLLTNLGGITVGAQPPVQSERRVARLQRAGDDAPFTARPRRRGVLPDLGLLRPLLDLLRVDLRDRGIAVARLLVEVERRIERDRRMALGADRDPALEQ